ncbi:hypothetical protein P7K49_035346 [Saguinus oedipus]|uniref:Uncharacterized protein n=1 Tax=Saguinus oedipus TaxID=9490 RepID=A0ABQ9TMC5_SAGOE|nr:hypothetical protein P7K49_035346 [Saguinus oedipus]
MTASAFTTQEYFAQRMAPLKNEPQLPDPGPDLPETQVDRKKMKKRNKEAAGKAVKRYPKPEAKRHMEENPKRDEAEEQGARKKSTGSSSEAPAGTWLPRPLLRCRDCAQPPKGLDFTLKPKKRRGKQQLQKPLGSQEDLLMF